MKAGLSVLGAKHIAFFGRTNAPFKRVLQNGWALTLLNKACSRTLFKPFDLLKRETIYNYHFLEVCVASSEGVASQCGKMNLREPELLDSYESDDSCFDGSSRLLGVSSLLI